MGDNAIFQGNLNQGNILYSLSITLAKKELNLINCNNKTLHSALKVLTNLVLRISNIVLITILKMGLQVILELFCLQLNQLNLYPRPNSDPSRSLFESPFSKSILIQNWLKIILIIKNAGSKNTSKLNQ